MRLAKHLLRTAKAAAVSVVVTRAVKHAEAGILRAKDRVDAALDRLEDRLRGAK